MWVELKMFYKLFEKSTDRSLILDVSYHFLEDLFYWRYFLKIRNEIVRTIVANSFYKLRGSGIPRNFYYFRRYRVSGFSRNSCYFNRNFICFSRFPWNKAMTLDPPLV